MSHIKIKRGLDIPIEGKVKAPNPLQAIPPACSPPKQLALNLTEFSSIKFRLLVKEGDEVKIGQPLCEDKEVPGRMFVSPAAGKVVDIRRGEKRRLLAIVIEKAENEEYITSHPFTLETATRQELSSYLMQHGLFAQIRKRPFSSLANPQKPPRAIFVRALESLPFLPPSEMQCRGYEREFQVGLDALRKLTDGKVHLVYHKDSTFKAFTEAKNVDKHTAQGPHPIASASVHISEIDPITKPDDVIWVVDAEDVCDIGYMIVHGRMKTDRVIAVAGSATLEEKRGYFTIRKGSFVHDIIQGRGVADTPVRWISGDVLTGESVEPCDPIGFRDTALVALSDTTSRQFLSFFRLGKDKYTASGAYLSGHLNPKTHSFSFTTSQHGEERAFIDGSVYERVMPLPVLPMQLVRALMSEDYELAVEYGLLEVEAEDFALCEFCCPSKIEMVDIVREGLLKYAKEVL